MDPNENLKEQLEIVEWLQEQDYTEDGTMDRYLAKSLRLAALVEALNDWIVKGGFIPEKWHQKQNMNGGW